jgi:exodeoxyribonuclease VIII
MIHSTLTKNMTNAEYHAMPGISKSGLDLINKSPAHYKWAHENPTPQTPAMRIGSLTHLAVLEPDRFDAECVVLPSLDRRTKAGKEAFEQFQADHPGFEMLTSDEHTRIIGIRDAVRAHPMGRKLLDRIAQVEVSTFWKDEDTGVDCRCRPDGILDNGMLIDLKTTTDAGREFERSVRQFRYHVQAAFYAMGNGGAPMIFIAAEKDPPYMVACYMFDPDTIADGEYDARQNLKTYAECLATDTWPGYSAGIQTISITQ